MRRRRIPELQGERRRVTCASISSASIRSCSRWSRNMTDDDIWRLNRGGHDPHKVYAAYAAAVKHKGQPTVILAKTDQGLRHGRGRRGPEHHAPAEEDGHDVDHGVPRPLHMSRSRTTSSTTCRSIRPPDDAPEMQYLHEPRASAGRLAAGAPAQARRRCEVPRARGVRGAAQGHATAARSRRRWRSCAF